MGQLGPCLVSILAVSCVSRLTSRGHSRATEMAQSSPFSLYYTAYPGLIFFNLGGLCSLGQQRGSQVSKVSMSIPDSIEGG